MTPPRQKDELRLTGIALLIVGLGILPMCGCMRILALDYMSPEYEQGLRHWLYAAALLCVGGIGCIVGARVRAARRARAPSRPAPREADPD